MLMRAELGYNNSIWRRLDHSLKKRLTINPIFHGPLPKSIEISTDFLVVEIRLWQPTPLHPVESHHIHAARTPQRLRQYIKTVVDMSLM